MDKKSELAKLRQKMEEAELPLKAGATRLVFGDGSADAEIFFLGEGPGYWEDMKGIPFVGNAGALLNRMLAAIGINREDVFISNVVHYRPPQNRDPMPEEIAAFAPYVDHMIEIIDPVLIVPLGRFSMGKFLPGVRIGAVHGKMHVVKFKGSKRVVVPMYHPAAALRSGEMMMRFRQDFLELPKILEEAGRVLKEDDGDENEDGREEEKVEQMGLI
jgi:uracil-DNA glycosylase family 4